MRLYSKNGFAMTNIILNTTRGIWGYFWDEVILGSVLIYG